MLTMTQANACMLSVMAASVIGHILSIAGLSGKGKRPVLVFAGTTVMVAAAGLSIALLAELIFVF